MRTSTTSTLIAAAEHFRTQGLRQIGLTQRSAAI